MAFWGRDRWLDQGKLESVTCPVVPWDEKRVEAAGYRLSIGDEIYVNGESGKSVRKLSHQEGFVIQPGQFAFILTKEKVYIPNAAIGFISIRASIKFLGLVNVSGFQVNPGFGGNLVFAVFNAGPKFVNLRQSDEIFSLWISDIDSETKEDFEANGKVPNNLDKITSDMINGIAGNALTAYQLSEKIDDLKKELAGIKTTATNIATILAVIITAILALCKDPIGRALFGGNEASSPMEVESKIQSDPTTDAQKKTPTVPKPSLPPKP